MESDQTPQSIGGPAGQQPFPPSTPTPPPSPGVSPAPDQPQGFRPISSSDLKKSSNRRKLGRTGIIVAVVAVLLTGSAGAYFGLILPNKPENIWKKALSNTAKGYDKLVDYAEESKDIKGIKATGTLKLEGAFTGDGSLEAESYEGNSKLKADFGFAGARFTVDALATTPQNSKTPDLYFRVGGIKGIGGLMQGSAYEDLGPFIDSLDEQWIEVDHTLFDQLSAASGVSSSAPTISDEDAFAIARAIGEVNRDYLLSADKDKRVLTVVKEVGKEDRDDRSTYHFEVGFDKDHMKDYLNALKDRLKQTKLKDVIGEQSINAGFDDAIASLDRQNEEDFDTVDVWVDMKTKLIRIIRFTDEKEEANFVEVGLAYNGGDEYPFFIDMQFPKDSQPFSGKLTAAINTKDDSVKLGMEINIDGTPKEKVTGELLIQPNDQPVDVQKPDGAKPVMEIIGSLFGGLSAGPSSSPTSSLPFPTDELRL